MFWLKKWKGSIGFALSKIKKAKKNMKTFMVFGVKFTIPEYSEFWIGAEEIVLKYGCSRDYWSLIIKDEDLSHEIFSYYCLCPSGKISTGWLIKFSGEHHIIENELSLFKGNDWLTRLIRKFKECIEDIEIILG